MKEICQRKSSFLLSRALPILLGLLFLLSRSEAADVLKPFMRYGSGDLRSVAYSPDGRFLAAGGGMGAVLHDPASGLQRRILWTPGHNVRRLAFSADSSRLVTGGYDKTARIWDVAAGVVIHTLSGHTGPVNGVAFAPDGTRVLTGSSDGYAKLWDAQTGSLLYTLASHSNLVYCVAYSRDGTKVATGSWDYTVKIWNPATGGLIQTITRTQSLLSLAFSPDGRRLVAGLYNNRAELWDVQSVPAVLLRTFAGHNMPVHAVAYSPDGNRILTGSSDHKAILFDAQSYANLATFTHDWTVVSVTFSPDSMTAVTASSDQTVKLWDVSGLPPTLVRTVTGYTGGLEGAVYTPDGAKILTCGSPKTASIWDVRTGGLIRTFNPHTEAILDIICSPDGTQFVTACGSSNDPTLKLWDLESQTLIRTFVGHTNAIYSCAFSPDGSQLVSGAYKKGGATLGEVKLWNVATGAILHEIFRGEYCSAVAFAPDGQTYLTGFDDGTAKIWTATSPSSEVLSVKAMSAGSVWAARFSPDGSRFLTGNNDGSARVWNVATGAVTLTLTGHQGPVYAVAFSPDGSRVVTGSEDATAKVWDSQTGQRLSILVGHGDAILACSFSPDGTQIMTASRDGTALTWELRPPRAIIVAGGGNFLGNSIADQTNDLGAYAYKALKRRDYEAEDILYLTAFPTVPGGSVPPGESAPWRDADGDGLNDVDGWATVENLKKALTGEVAPGASASIPADFATSAGRLLILMIDHGARTQSFMTFRVNETQALPSTTLDGWLDDLQTPATGSGPEVTLVVDSCYSGQIMDDCRLTTGELTGK